MSDADSDTPNCGSMDNGSDFFHLRIASVFIILVTSMFAALFPVMVKRTSVIRIPDMVYNGVKYFGSGIIIATAFIHLLDPAIEELSSPCLTGTWQEYPWALAISMFGVFGIFFLELAAYRIGSARLKALGFNPDPHGHGVGPSGTHAAHGPESGRIEEISDDHDKTASSGDNDLEKAEIVPVLDDPIPQIIGIGILEFGVLLHSVLIGLTLATDPGFKVLFVVIVFHQMFEGLGLGTRLGILPLPKKYNYVPYVGGLLYGLCTPVGIAAGLGIRSTYNPDSPTAAIVSGVMDALSSGILLYTGLVELLAHEFLFNPSMTRASGKHITFASIFVLLGAGIMSLLGRWA